MVTVRLTWEDTSDSIVSEDLFNIYRSTAPFHSGSLPPILGTVPANQEIYEDTTAITGTLYYYAVGAKLGSDIALSSVEPILVSGEAPVYEDHLGTRIIDRAGLEAMTGNGHYYLAENIDLGDADWTPIEFHGVFDMGGFTISNMNVVGSGSEPAGLIGNGNYCSVSNGTFNNCTSTAASSAYYNGVVCGISTGGIFQDIVCIDCDSTTSGARAGVAFGALTDCAVRRVLVCNSTLTGARGANTNPIAGFGGGSHMRTRASYYDNTASTPASAAIGTSVTAAWMKTASNWSTTILIPSMYTLADGEYPVLKELVYTEIATKADLEGMNQVDGLYRLVADIDCSGGTFNNSGTTFNGILDGDGYRIYNVDFPTFTGEESVIFGGNSMCVVKNTQFEVNCGYTSAPSGNYNTLFGTSNDIVVMCCNVTGTFEFGAGRGAPYAGWGRAYIYKSLGAADIGTTGGLRENALKAWEYAGEDWGYGNVNATALTGNTNTTYNDKPEPGTSAIGSPVDTADGTYDSRYWSHDLWVIDDVSVPVFKAI